MRSLYLRFRRFCRSLLGAPGWKTLVREVAAVPTWQGDGLVGLPLEFTLLHREGGRVVADPPTVCTDSGIPVSGLVPTHEGEPVWGVRCARCRVPLASTHAGMRVSNDIPSCLPCRSAVRRVVRG